MKYQQNREIAWRAIEGEAVLFDTAAGMMRQLNPLGTELWTQLETPRTIQELVEFVLAGWQVDERCARVDIDRFLATLVERKLVLQLEESA